MDLNFNHHRSQLAGPANHRLHQVGIPKVHQ